MFNKKYYKNIWGTIHRHDYCESLADQLIQKYGKVRILDIGTGCGYLVKLLREKGCDAWGLEISKYAVDNSCAPMYTKKGSITRIPFLDNSFDVVISQGLWEYIKKPDISKSVLECKRVGKIQEHNIDTTECVIYPEYQVTTLEPRSFWEGQLYG